MWPFQKKNIQKIPIMIPQAVVNDEILPIGEQKQFDWYSYQMQQYEGGLFGDEFTQIVSKDTLKAAACKEIDLAKAINAISRQFLGAKFALMNRNGEQQFRQNQITETLSKGIFQESSATFHQMRIFDLISTGEAFAWISDNGMQLVSLASERTERIVENGIITGYKSQKKSGRIDTYEKKNVIDWRLPNPFSRYTGLSMLVSLLMEILTRKYGKEWTVGFFLRGGSMAGQYYTESGDSKTLARLMATIQQMVGSRRNMHSDKLLPKGVTLAASAPPFSSVQIVDLLRANSRDIYSALGVPPVAVGDTDGVNYASADQQMTFFWEATILPFQNIYCSCIMENETVKRFIGNDTELVFDNSKNKYLDDFAVKLEQDIKLSTILTIDERRKRLGFEPIGDERGDKLQGETQVNPFALSIENKNVETNEQEHQEEQLMEYPSIVKRMASDQAAGEKEEELYKNEVQEWQKIVLSLLEDQQEAYKIIKGRAVEYGKEYAKTVINDVMEMYDAQILMLEVPKEKAMTKGEKEDRMEEFRKRSVDFLTRQVAADASGSFVGFSETWTNRIYAEIQRLMTNNYSMNDIATGLKDKFNEYYEGQFKTVVNTEYRSSLNRASQRFGSDLSNAAKKIAKIWMAKIDSATRDSHFALDGQSISGDSKTVPELSFKPGMTLRYPMDGSAPAEEVINCRCTLRWKVIKWE